MNRLRAPPWLPALLLLAAGAFWFSLQAGALRLPAGEVLSLLTGREGPPAHVAVVRHVRLPRALLAAMVGASLGAAGAAFQGVLRNPLADPYVLGVSGGAALGAGLAMLLGGFARLSVPLASFAGALLALGVVYGAARAHRASATDLILSGVMVGSFSSALLLFVLWLGPADPARAALFWLTGDLSAADPAWLAGASVLALVAFAALWSRSSALDLLTQGEEAAGDLGLDIGRARLWVFAAGGALTAAAVSSAGLVGFAGLVVPHAARMLWGPCHRRLLPASALLGATFLLAADGVARTVLAPAEVPVGVITALVGAPFFLHLLRRNGSTT